MVTDGHKKITAEEMQRFIRRIQEEATILIWKQGHYMDHAKIKATTITYWPGKGTMILQGPKEEAGQFNMRLLLQKETERGDTERERATIPAMRRGKGNTTGADGGKVRQSQNNRLAIFSYTCDDGKTTNYASKMEMRTRKARTANSKRSTNKCRKQPSR